MDLTYLSNGGISLKKIRLAIPTDGKRGMNDTVSEVLGRAKTFTLIKIKGNTIDVVEVLENPASSYKHGAGPIVVKMLIDKGVNMITAREFGPGASTLLDQHKVTMIKVKAGITVSEVIKESMKKL
jgi:predicted Fe-Mo cluster-binding NifX family protein